MDETNMKHAPTMQRRLCVQCSTAGRVICWLQFTLRPASHVYSLQLCLLLLGIILTTGRIGKFCQVKFSVTNLNSLYSIYWRGSEHSLTWPGGRILMTEFCQGVSISTSEMLEGQKLKDELNI